MVWVNATPTLNPSPQGGGKFIRDSVKTHFALVFRPAAEQVGFYFQQAIENGTIDIGEPEA
jgi:hypothetical protein